MSGTVIIFVKTPVAGRVKTRLAADIGAGRATAVFRALMAHTIRQASAGAWDKALAVDPPSAVAGWGGYWPRDFDLIAQGAGNLGDRMRRVATKIPSGPVVIIGADAPGLRRRHLRAAFTALKGADAVFGPARDGGYWLIGLARRRPAPDLFRHVRWSTSHALEDTHNSLPKSFQVALLDEMGDVDTVRDLGLIKTFSTAR